MYTLLFKFCLGITNMNLLKKPLKAFLVIIGICGLAVFCGGIYQMHKTDADLQARRLG
jgi:hypothetical protein